MGWSGVAVDALAEFAEGYRQHRPRTRFVAMFAGDRDDAEVTLYVPEGEPMLASSSAASTMRDGMPGAARQVPTGTLNTLLARAGVTRLDFLSMDIELAEPQAWAGFDLARSRSALVCIEAHPEVRQAIIEHFARHRYVLVGRYLRLDPHNLCISCSCRRNSSLWGRCLSSTKPPRPSPLIRSRSV